jgi:hypothetical protein
MMVAELRWYRHGVRTRTADGEKELLEMIYVMVIVLVVVLVKVTEHLSGPRRTYPMCLEVEHRYTTTQLILSTFNPVIPANPADAANPADPADPASPANPANLAVVNILRMLSSRPYTKP